eukprot:TRINITY_DN13559_c0_g1_i1.p1 TRINITY_DN13559_c0_g1~~TRINITY_DN13559_c0_g1_i1.p1  ORF type:complete len:1002 (-),score=408.50 TRINITY_DN13559_c0_g1_i1:92-3097(-)
MGQMKEVKVESEAMEDPEKLKGEGNDAFKAGKYEEALVKYTKAIELTDKDNDKSTYLKNRAAVHLKNDDYDKVVEDCTAALEISQNDPKALYRRCQAYEALDKVEQAYSDAKAVHNCDPKNKAIEPFLLRLHAKVQAKINEMSTTANKVTKMFELVFNVEEEMEKREKAADNMIVLAKDRVGAELLFKEGVVQKIVRLMKVETNQKIRLSLVRVFGDLGKTDMERAKIIVREAGIPFFLNALNTSDEEAVNAVVYVIQCLLDSISQVDLVDRWQEKLKNTKNNRMNVTERKQKRADELQREEILKANSKELDSIMHVICFNTTSRTLTAIAREALINLIMKNCKYDQLNWADKMLTTDSYQRLMEVASEINMPEFKYESAMDITDSTKTIVGVTFGFLYEQMYDDRRREALISEVGKFTQEKLMDPGMESKVRIVVAITTLLTNAPELGNSQLKEGLLEMMLVMARSEEYIQQLVASEAIIAAASKKKDVTAIVNQGLDILKTLYKSTNDHIKVRALVGLCKLGASGGSDAALRPFADGSSTKLAEACRRFLVNPEKDSDLRRWAAEGLSFLTLDAEVKEKLVEDESAMRALIELGKTGAQNVMYGVLATLVNITNSYDKQEINPEMLELAKFAKHHIPEEHELDDEDFADKRIWSIAKMGVTSALVSLSKTESHNMRELIARVLNAVCKHVELRGLVVQQGGSKALIPMALEGTDKGTRCAASALARIGITQDPAIAFPGQRSCDVVRPISLLLDPECEGLENFESLMALGNLASLNESTRKRILKDGNCIQAIENFMFEEHELIRRAAVQCWTNLCVSDVQVKRCEGENDKVKYCVLLCGDDVDHNVVKAASGALAMLTSASNKCCKKVFESKQWNDCLLNLLASTDVEICFRGCVIVQNMVASSKDTAEKVLETQIMEVLQALVVKANLDSGSAQPNPILVKVKGVCEKTLEEAHKMNIVRTQQEAVIAEEEKEDDVEPWMRAPTAGSSGVPALEAGK